MKEDIVENIRDSLIQHGHHNNRIYLMRLNMDNLKDLIPALDNMAREKGYGKILAKVPAPSWYAFKTAGYSKEAVVPRFFRGEVDCFFIAKYFSPGRQSAGDVKSRQNYFDRAAVGTVKVLAHYGGTKQKVVPCKPSDAAEMSAIYRQVFRSYPFPIQKPAFLEHMMAKGNLYFSIRRKNRIAAIAAAEIDPAGQNAEMTDFATLPEWRGRGFAGGLLRHMQGRVRSQGIQTAYTIARAESHGMNSVFRTCGYHYGGLLRNNSQISGSIRSMTVWYKHL